MVGSVRQERNPDQAKRSYSYTGAHPELKGGEEGGPKCCEDSSNDGDSLLAR